MASIGYGLAFQLQGAPSVSTGIVAAIGRNLDDGYGGVWIQHQSPINHGDSGGPLLDMRGNVVGVNTQSIDDDGGAVQGVFLAIPSSIAERTATQLIAATHQGPTFSLNAARRVSTRVSTGYYAVTLPPGWFVNRLNRAAPVALSRDELAQVSLRVVAVHGHQGKAQLSALIGQLARASGHVKHSSYTATTAGRLRGYMETVTYTNKPYQLALVAVPNKAGRAVYVLSTFIRKGATAADRRQAMSIVSSLQPLR